MKFFYESCYMITEVKNNMQNDITTITDSNQNVSFEHKQKTTHFIF